MRKNHTAESGFFNPRTFVAFLLCSIAASLGFISFAANPTGAAISASTTTPVTWEGTATGTGAAGGESSCVDGTNCDTFTLTVNPASDWTGKRIEVRIQQATSEDDTDLVIHKTDNTGPTVANSGNGAGITEVGYITPSVDGTGIFTIHVIYFATVPTHQYHGSATVVSLTPTPPPDAAIDSTNKIGYENFEVPGALTNVTVDVPNDPGPGVTQVPTVEYVGRSAGEPSIGVNWNTDVTNFQSDLETLFVTFTNGCGDHGPLATWVNRVAPTSKAIDSDPIGFTDHAGSTQRVFSAELTATSPTCKISYTDTDGTPANTGWVATPGPLGSGIDHETIGGGPFNEGAVPPPVHPTYPNAVYYCSQDLVAAFCLRSDDGGATFNTPPIDTYTTECGGLHGHVKVGPDGTVYLPNKDCSGNEAAVVSENNGVTWSVRPVGNAGVQPGASQSDPAVAIDANNRVYFAMATDDASATIAVSSDHGQTWPTIVNVSRALGLQNVRYPAAVAGDNGRAAIAFLGSTTAGDANSANFNGVWHLYVAHTFDGGATWTTTDATPNMPVQRGCIWTGGGANICRNLLDFFDIAIDKEGRVQVGYPNGCSGGDCAQSASTATGNAYAATATIARQSSGKRLLQAYDPTGAATAPGMPFVTQRRAGSVVHLAWSEADSGGAVITSYDILRGTAAGTETLLTTVPAGQSNYDDYSAADSAKTYYYKVVANNSQGGSCPNNEIAAPFIGDTCSGLIIHQNDPSHPESTAANTNPQLAIDYVAAGEPYQVGADNLMFKLKVSDLSTLPANSRWRVVWDSFASPGQQFYVGMTTDNSSVPTFEYGTLATAVVGLVLGVPQETQVGVLPQGPANSSTLSNYSPDGTITIYVPRSAVGNPQKGDLLGAVNGRTFADNTAYERSTQLIDHTFVKSQTDNAYPTATYTVTGPNLTCAVTSADSVKTHGNAGPFSIHLPVVGTPGIEPRLGGSSAGDHTVVVTFAVPVASVASVSPSSGAGTAAVNGNTVTVNLTGVANGHTIGINLVGVSDGTHTSDVLIPMSVLLGDVNQDGFVLSGDYTATRSKSGSGLTGTTFKYDVNTDGFILSGDYTIVRSQSGKSLQ